MTFVIRPARAEDIPLIADWTRDTFSWGDYVAEQLPVWLEDTDSLVVACVFDDDVPVAVSRAQLLSSTEAWLSGARVHPDHRRSGMGMAMNDAGVEWARSRGARVARLAVEEENQPARSQVEKAGYRQTGRWVHATVGATSEPHLTPEVGIRLRASIKGQQHPGRVADGMHNQEDENEDANDDEARVQRAPRSMRNHTCWDEVSSASRYCRTSASGTMSA